MFEVETDEATLVELAQLAQVDLEHDDFVVYAQPLDEVPLYNEPHVDSCGMCVLGEHHATCIEARCKVIDTGSL